jgi:hypothetical protein
MTVSLKFYPGQNPGQLLWMPPTWVAEASAVLAARRRFPGGKERTGGSGTAGTSSSERRATPGNRRLRYPRGRRPTAAVRGTLAASPFLIQAAVGAGQPLIHLRPSAPSATFVSRARICKPFEGAQESIPSLAESIPGAQESIPSLAGRYDNPARSSCNRLLRSLNVYKYGLRRLRVHITSGSRDFKIIIVSLDS